MVKSLYGRIFFRLLYVEPPRLRLFSIVLLLAEDQVEMVLQVAVLWWMS